MSKRKSSPALYEVIRSGHGSVDRSFDTRAEGAPRSPEPIRHREPYEATALVRWLQPGRSLQIPVGYVLCSIALVLVLVWVTYMIGFSRGQYAERMIYEDDLYAAGLLDDSERHPRDPVLSAGASGQPRDSAGQTAPSLATSRTDGTGQEPAGWGPLVSDPREPGKWYLYLTTTSERYARNYAEFCREHGLEVYVLVGNNPSHTRVVAMPGFESRTSSEAERLKHEALRIADRWASATGDPGPRDQGPLVSRYGGG